MLPKKGCEKLMVTLGKRVNHNKCMHSKNTLVVNYESLCSFFVSKRVGFDELEEKRDYRVCYNFHRMVKTELENTRKRTVEADAASVDTSFFSSSSSSV